MPTPSRRQVNLAVLTGIAALGPVAAGHPLLPGAAAAGRPADTHPDLTLWYDEVAPDSNTGWERNSLPIGNGTLGASIFGGISIERVQFNEKTLWNGGPGVQGYNFGNWTAPRPGALEGLRQRIWNEGPIDKDAVVRALGFPSENPRPRLFGAYQNFGDLRLTMTGPSATTAASDYRRYLDISTALAGVTYVQGGVTYRREYFASAKHDVIVGRLTASKPGSISLRAAVSTPTNRTKTTSVAAGRITTRGELNDNKLVHESQVQVLNEGGTRSDLEGPWR